MVMKPPMEVTLTIWPHCRSRMPGGTAFIIATRPYTLAANWRWRSSIEDSSSAWVRSTALWALALGAGEGIPEKFRQQALDYPPRQLALAFRGDLSFWTPGELADAALGPDARAIACTLVLRFTERSR